MKILNFWQKILKILKSNHNTEIIETFALINEMNNSIYDSLSEMKLIYKTNSINNALKVLNSGETVISAIKEIYDDYYFVIFLELFLQSNKLAEAIRLSLAIVKEKNKIFNKTINRLFYPVLLIFGLLLFSLIVIGYLQPQFNTFYKSFEIEMSTISIIIRNIIFTLPFVMIALLIVLIIQFITYIKAIVAEDIVKIEQLCKYKLYRSCTNKYFSIMFCIYFKELTKLNYDIHTIFEIMNTKLNLGSLKIIVYELTNRLNNGDDFYNIIDEFEYFEDYFKQTLKISLKVANGYLPLNNYYQLSVMKFEKTMKKITTTIIVAIYAFSSLYLISIYLFMVIPMMDIVKTI